MGESLWQKDRIVTHILFDLCLSKHLSPVANFGDQSLFRQGYYYLTQPWDRCEGTEATLISILLRDRLHIKVRLF